jgi:hypothetical protein
MPFGIIRILRSTSPESPDRRPHNLCPVKGTVEGHEMESLELLIDDENGLLLERTVAYRPFPAVKIFRDRMIALNAGRVPDDMWDYPKATEA